MKIGWIEFCGMVLRLQNEKTKASKEEMLLNGVLGLCGEAGETADIVKKARYQGHPLDRDKLINELGDVLWYWVACCLAIGVEPEEVMRRNMEKLNKRFPSGSFSTEQSMSRKDTA